jgi:hypothetical protein
MSAGGPLVDQIKLVSRNRQLHIPASVLSSTGSGRKKSKVRHRREKNPERARGPDRLESTGTCVTPWGRKRSRTTIFLRWKMVRYSSLRSGLSLTDLKKVKQFIESEIRGYHRTVTLIETNGL